jgi:hypothetical protein
MHWLVTHGTDLMAALGAIVMLARIIVKLTPTPADDTALATLIEILKHLGLHVPEKR